MLALVLTVICALITIGLTLLVIMANGMSSRPTNGIEGISVVLIPLLFFIVFGVVWMLGG